MSIRKTLGVAAAAALLLSSASASLASTPTPEQVRAAYRSSDAALLDRHGEPLQTLRIDMHARRLEWVSLADISPAMTVAVIQAEDQRFYTHHGVDLTALGKAAWDNLFHDHARGASTITMQLASLLDEQLHPHQGRRNLDQKWDQIAAARALEESWNKNQILEAYLNLVSFRGELQGVDAASRRLFGKAPSGLDDVESTILASLIRAPNAPPGVVGKRACALAKERKSAASCTTIATIANLAFARELFNDGSQVSGPAAQVAQKLLKQPGGKVVSTIDASVQRFALESLRQQLSSLGSRNVRDGAIVVMDNRSGAILAYVGNGGDKSVDGVAALRQAGSTLKPFLYELAIEKRLLTASSILDDSPVDISTPGGLYVPQNYDKDFKGYVSVRTSLGSSLNVPAVRTLVLTGIDDFYNRLRDVGLSSLVHPADYYGYSLALGSAEVSLLDLANAYRTLANGGLYAPPTLLPADAQTTHRVIDAAAAYIVSDILSDRAARSITFGLSNELATPFWSAAKTGTSKDMRDNWCIGFSQKYTVGVWVGNFDGEPMWDVSGVTGAAPIWRDMMDFLHKNAPGHAPTMPAGVLRQQISYVPALEAPRNELFLAGTERTKVELLAESKRSPKIRYPGNGSIIAIDPDIPDANQRIFFQAQSGNGLTWQLDNVKVGSADAEYPWRPLPGTHHLTIIDEQGKSIDSISFQVRGNYHSLAGTSPEPIADHTGSDQ